MRLALVFLLLLRIDPEYVDVALVILPLVCLCGGMALGILLGREGFAFQFKSHVDKHFFAVNPVAGCRFCNLERGLRS